MDSIWLKIFAYLKELKWVFWNVRNGNWVINILIIQARNWVVQQYGLNLNLRPDKKPLLGFWSRPTTLKRMCPHSGLISHYQTNKCKCDEARSFHACLQHSVATYCPSNTHSTTIEWKTISAERHLNALHFKMDVV